MLSYAKSATARPGDRLNGFKNSKTQLFNSRGVELSVPLNHHTNLKMWYIKYDKNSNQLTAHLKQTHPDFTLKNVSGYVCNHGSPSGERDTASPRGRYGERPQRDSVWRYICKNTTCWPATAHDVTTGVPQYKCRRENTSSASSSEACVRSMARILGDAVSRSPLGEPWLHT